MFLSCVIVSILVALHISFFFVYPAHSTWLSLRKRGVLGDNYVVPSLWVYSHIPHFTVFSVLFVAVLIFDFRSLSLGKVFGG